jgi:hypothetical protein
MRLELAEAVATELPATMVDRLLTTALNATTAFVHTVWCFRKAHPLER